MNTKVRKNEKLKRKIKKNLAYFGKLSYEEQEDPELIQEAISPNRDGEYSKFPFNFRKPISKYDFQLEVVEDEQERERLKFFPDSTKLNFRRFLGKGANGRAYLITVPKFELERTKSNYPEEKKKEYKPYVLKMYNAWMSSNKMKESIERDALYVPPHPNVCPVLYHRVNYKIHPVRLPDYHEYWKLNSGSRRMCMNIIIMKYHRQDLQRYVYARANEWKPFRNLEYCYILRGLLRGAKHLHDNFIVHRDLHPQNIFVSEAYGRIWIGDFGCSLNLKEHKNKSNYRVYKDDEILFCLNSISSMSMIKGGYHRYMAPELANFDEETDEFLDYSKSDLYSCGKIGEYIVLSFFKNSRMSLEDLRNDWFVDSSIVKLIRSLLFVDINLRTTFDTAVSEIESLTKEFEETVGEIDFDMEDRKKLSLKYLHEGRNLNKYGNYVKCIVSCRKFVVLEEEMNPRVEHRNHKWIYVAYYNMGLANKDLGNYQESLDCFTFCVNILDKHGPICDEKYWSQTDRNECKVNCYGQISFGHLMLNDQDKAEYFLDECSRILHKNLPNTLRYKVKIAYIYRKRGQLHKMCKEFEKSLEWLEKCAKLETELLKDTPKKNGVVMLYSTYREIGSILSLQKKYSLAELYFRKSLDEGYRSMPIHHPQLSRIYLQLANAYLELGEENLSIENFKKSLECNPKKRTDLVSIYLGIGKIYEKRGNYIEAAEYFGKGKPELEEHYTRVCSSRKI